MAVPGDLHMPGAYCFDPATPATSQPLSATVFRPPISPSASSSVYNFAKSTGSLYSGVSVANGPGVGAKRKRTRDQVSRASTPNADWNMNMDGAGDARQRETPLLRQQRQEDDAVGGASEIRYTLAGQIETPTGAPPRLENGILDNSVYSDIDYRRELGPKRPWDDLESPSMQLSGLHLETPTTMPVTPRQVGWSALALTTIGGVVGKVWEFCKAGGFRGFQAGGGERYGVDGDISTPSRGGSRPWCNEHDLATLDAEDESPGLTNVPGGFPQTTSEYVSLHELSTPDSTPRPAVKRRQTSATHGDELRRNWVIVDQQSSPSAPAAAPTNPPPKDANLRAPRSSATSFTSKSAKPSSVRPSMPRSGPHQARYSTPTTSSSRRISVPVSRLGTTTSATPASSRPRASLRVSHAGSPALSSHSRASYAAPRSPSSLYHQHSHNPSFSPSRIPLPTNPANGSAPPTTRNPFAIPGTTTTTTSRPSSRCASPAPFLSGHHNRNASSASARLKSESSGGAQDSSPRLTAEAKQLAARKLAAERNADAKMEAFNRRLMDMIRQGKEALGATVEVEMELGAPTAGWEDDD